MAEQLTMTEPDFRFYLIHKSGYQVLGATEKQENGYVMFRLYHPSAQVYGAMGQRSNVQYVGGLGNDQIQNMIESGEWEIAASDPFE